MKQIKKREQSHPHRDDSLQQESVRKALAIILPKLGKNLFGFELRLVPVLTCKTDENLAARLKGVAIKHSQVISNAATYKIEGITNIDQPLPNTPHLSLRKLIMSIKTEDKNSFVITITRNWHSDLELWAKKKCKKFASVAANHLPA